MGERGELKESTEPGFGPVEAPVYKRLFLVQLCADTPFSERSLSLTRSGENILWGVVTIT